MCSAVASKVLSLSCCGPFSERRNGVRKAAFFFHPPVEDTSILELRCTTLSRSMFPWVGSFHAHTAQHATINQSLRVVPKKSQHNNNNKASYIISIAAAWFRLCCWCCLLLTVELPSAAVIVTAQSERGFALLTVEAAAPLQVYPT